MNILVDQATAEVVHIDLGVAFEQGLMLKTPERVCLFPSEVLLFCQISYIEAGHINIHKQKSMRCVNVLVSHVG